MKHYCVALLALALLCPASAQSADTLNDVWIRDGGARLYYDALVRPRDLNMNGARWEDPALNHRLPPLYEPQPRKRRAVARPVAPAPAAQTGVSALPPQTGARPALPVAPPAATTPAPAAVRATPVPAGVPAPVLGAVPLPAPAPLPVRSH